MESNLICTYNHTSDFLITIMIIDRREQNKVLKPIDQNYTKKKLWNKLAICHTLLKIH